MFEPGDYIHYSSSGLCRVEEITTLNMSGADQKRLYYRLVPLEGHGSTIYTPVDNQKVPMRRALSMEEASRLIDELPGIDLISIHDEKKREQAYKDALASADCKDWVGLIKTLYGRRNQRLKEGKKVTATEEKYYQAALGRLNAEIALAMGIEKNEVEAFINKRVSRHIKNDE